MATYIILGEVMGLFSIFKRKAKISLQQNLANVFFYEVPFKKGEPKIDSPVQVPAGHLFVLTDKRKVLDVLGEGEHELTTATIPQATQRFSLLEKDKTGKIKKEIPCRCFYLTKGDFRETWKTLSLQYKTDKDGIFGVRFLGEFAFSITDEKRFFSVLYEQSSCRNEKQARKSFLHMFLNLVNDSLERKNFSTEVCSEKQEIETFLMQKAAKAMQKNGITINEITITGVIFDSRTTAKLANQKAEEAKGENKIETDAAASPEPVQSKQNKEESAKVVLQETAEPKKANFVYVPQPAPVSSAATPETGKAKPTVPLFGGDRVLLKQNTPKQFVNFDDEE